MTHKIRKASYGQRYDLADLRAGDWVRVRASGWDRQGQITKILRTRVRVRYWVAARGQSIERDLPVERIQGDANADARIARRERDAREVRLAASRAREAGWVEQQRRGLTGG